MVRFVCGGLTTFDLVYLADELPERGGKGTAGRSYTDVGGPVASAAVTAVLLGSEAVVHSVFGKGPFAALAVAALTDYGVAIVDHEPAIDLPVASVWVDGAGERTIISTDNKRSEVLGRPELVNLDGVAAVLLDGHYPHLQEVLAQRAAAAGIPIVLDCGRWRSVFADLLPIATDVIMTESFRPPEFNGAQVTETVGGLRERHGLELCAATRGPDPVLVDSGSGVVGIEVPSVDAVDTTGAGDVMHGAYLHYRYGEALDGAEALSRAAVVASESCRYLGARAGIEALLEDRRREP